MDGLVRVVGPCGQVRKFSLPGGGFILLNYYYFIFHYSGGFWYTLGI